MPNPMKGEAEVALGDGRKLIFAFNANAWIAIEDELGMDTPDIVDKLQTGRASMKVQRAVMWGGLRKYQPELTPEDAGELLIEAAEGMAKALTGGMPQGEGGESSEDEPHPIHKRGRGTNSTANGAVAA